MTKCKLLLLSLSILSLPSCALLNDNTLYDAPTVPIPLFQNKNTLKATVGYGFYSGIQANGGYSFTKNFAGIGSINFNHNTWSTLPMGIISEKQYQLKNHSFEAGFGLYFPKQASFFNVKELYVGGGIGSENKIVSFAIIPDYHGPQGKFKKYFTQFNFGRVSSTTEFGLATRFSILKYGELRYYHDYLDSFDNLENTTILNLEPVFMFSKGNEKIKLITQAGFSAPIIAFTNGQKNYYKKGSTIFNIGINLNFNNVFKKPIN